MSMGAESIRDVVDDILRDCRFPEEHRRHYHERAAKALWRDRTEVLEIVKSQQRTPGGGPRGRVARFTLDQAFGRRVRPL